MSNSISAIIVGVIGLLATLFIAWLIRRINKKDREEIKAIIREEVKDRDLLKSVIREEVKEALSEHVTTLNYIKDTIEEMKENSVFMNQRIMEKFFENWK